MLYDLIVNKLIFNFRNIIFKSFGNQLKWRLGIINNQPVITDWHIQF